MKIYGFQPHVVQKGSSPRNAKVSEEGRHTSIAFCNNSRHQDTSRCDKQFPDEVHGGRCHGQRRDGLEIKQEKDWLEGGEM